jgi:hypothetical protein
MNLHFYERCFPLYWALLSIPYRRHSLENQQFPQFHFTDAIYLRFLC